MNRQEDAPTPAPVGNPGGHQLDDVTSPVEWERDVYARHEQVNRWPFSDLVADVRRVRRSMERADPAALEVGCGTGNNLWFLLEEGFQASGIDIAPTAIQLADEYLRRRGFAQVDLKTGSVNRLPWDDGVFDLVIDRGALTQLPIADVGVAVSEIHRVLRPGGVFFSYHLFGAGCSDRRFGTELAPGSHANFTEGRFKGLPLTTFFEVGTIRTLWSPFRLDRLTVTRVHADGSSAVEERFTVHARKGS